MRMDKSKAAIVAVIALVIVCAGSFFAVRSINQKTKPQTVLTISSMEPLPVTSETQTTIPPLETAEPLSTVPLSQVTGEAAPDSLFTTFALPSTTGTTLFTLPTTTTQPTTEATTEATTESTTESTTRFTLPADTNQEDTVPDETQGVTRSGAVFSDGLLGYQYDRNGNFYFTTNDPWQRNFGFNELYDMGAPFVNFYYDTIRCKFRYDNKDWMIQFWKGQYGFVFLGGEIGVYNKPADRSSAHYDAASDKDRLYMSMTLYRKGVERASRDYAKYWWCTAFIPGTLDKFSDRSELSMKCRITLKDREMRDQFVAALEQNGFKQGTDFSISGRDVYFSWT